MSERTDFSVWVTLRAQEASAASAGGERWDEYVLLCKQRLGLPWHEIREEFARMDAATPARVPVEEET